MRRPSLLSHAHWSSLFSRARWSSLLSRAHWSAVLPVNRTTEFQLLLTTCATGLQDVVVLQDFICFASGQTGNIVKASAGFGLPPTADHPYRCLVLPAISLGSFVAAVFLTGRASAYFGARRRGLQVALGLGQTVVLGVTVWVLQHAHSQSHQQNNNENGDHEHRPFHLNSTLLSTRLALALLAAATASQIAAARAWDLSEITTAMATGALVDLFNDPNFFALHNRRRNLRVVFFLVLVASCVFAAVLKRWGELESSGLLGVSVGVKGLAVAVLGWMDAGEQEGDGKGDGGVVGVGGDGSGGEEGDVEEGQGLRMGGRGGGKGDD